jgi:phage-related protein
VTRPHRPAGEKPLHWVRLARAVYVLHVFQKKSPTGIRTALRDARLIEERLKVAREDYEARYGGEEDRG